MSRPARSAAAILVGAVFSGLGALHGLAAADEPPADADLPESLPGPLAQELAYVRVRYRGELQPLVDVVRRAAADPQLAEYRRRRAEQAGTPEGEVALAHWCRQQGLAEEEQLHWKILLSLAPDDPDAIQGLELRKYHGLLVTKRQIDEAKAQASQAKQAARRWTPTLNKWKHAIEKGNAQERAAAIHELQSLNDPLALPLVEEVFSLDDAAIAMTLVEVAKKNPGDDAADLLARLAVDASDDYVRQSAAAALAARPYPSYVPALLARLATPIELSVDATKQPGGPIVQSYTAYSYTGRMGPAFYNKVRTSGDYGPADVAAWGPEVARSSGAAVIGYEPDRVEYNYVLSRDSADPDAPDEISGTIVETAGAPRKTRRVSSIDELRASIDEANAQSAALNRRIHAALTLATNAQVVPDGAAPPKDDEPIDPRWWWDWWRRQTAADAYFSGGTEVWTLAGPTPIEHILVGDRVLTRNDAGELAFSLVLAVDSQGESVMQTLELGSRTIVATPDAQFRVANLGWKRAADLIPGMQLETLAGPQPLERVAPGDAIARHGLYIADGPTIFVDRNGIEAHDATTR